MPALALALALPRAGDDLAVMEPALGQAWSHTCSNLVQLRWDVRIPGQRVAALVKSSFAKSGVAKYVVTRDGVRTAAAPRASGDSGAGGGGGGGGGGVKRPRTAM